ncbi:MAG: glycosyltransferase [Gemmatimonadaceae bacterium]
MRLLFLQLSKEWTGGTGVFTTVATALAARGYDTAIAAPEGSEALRSTRNSPAELVDLGPHPATLWHSWRLAARIAEYRADTVFVHTDEEHLITARALHRAQRGALVRRIPAGGRLEVTRRTRTAERLWPTRYLYTTESPPTGHAAPSGTLTALRAELGVPVPDARPPAVADGYGILACIASREALRRATNVLRAASLLAQQHPAMRVRVIGSAATDPELQVLASALGIGRRVEWITHAGSIADALSGASAGWVVADGDDAALGLLQLMAHGIVPLSERSAVAARYVSPNIHGILMTTLDPPAMAAETTVLLADRERRLTMGAAGRGRVEREFTLREMLAGFEQVARASRERRTPA